MTPLAACISRWPSTTRWPWLAYRLLPKKGSSTDTLARGVDVSKALQQTLSIALQRAPIGTDHPLRELGYIRAAGEVLDRHDQRRVAGGTWLTVDGRRG